MKQITIDGTVYVPQDEAPSPAPVRIVILQRGWVMVGRFHQEGPHCVLTNAHVIRQWGTERGLGQTAREGTTDKTQLDAAGTVRFHELTIIATLDCDESRWPQC